MRATTKRAISRVQASFKYPDFGLIASFALSRTGTQKVGKHTKMQELK
jgi:hypothetical protein